MAQNGLGRIIILLVIKTVHASKIRNSALSRHTRTSEKDHVITVFNYFYNFFDVIHLHSPHGEIFQNCTKFPHHIMWEKIDICSRRCAGYIFKTGLFCNLYGTEHMEIVGYD